MKRARTWSLLAVLLLLAAGVYFGVHLWIVRAYRGTEPIALDAEPAAATSERAFPHLEFDRPVGLTFPPDGTNRIAVISQSGRVYLFPNDPNTQVASELIDIYTFGEDEAGEVYFTTSSGVIQRFVPAKKQTP